MQPVISLSQGPILLRPLRPEDQHDRLRMGRDPEYVRLCGGDPRHLRPMTAKQAQSWYESLAAEPYAWAIVVEGRCIGHARLHALNALDRRARYAIGIFDPTAWGRGYGTTTTRLVLGYAFDVLGLHRVDLRVLCYNTRAIACYVKCGFQREGIELEGALIAGEWQDDVIMSILEHEYGQLEPEWREEEGEAS